MKALLMDPKPTKAARWKKSLKAARIYADHQCREWVKTQYDRCVTCRNTVGLEWAHVLSGKGSAVRWDMQNVTRQCSPCNQLHEYEPEHLIAWFLKTYGQPALFALTVRSNVAVKYTFDEIMAKGDAYRALLERSES